MSGSTDGGQGKSTDVEQSRLDEFARDQLQAILPASIASGFEKGAVICRNLATGELTATPVNTGTVKHTVDVGTALPNCGCKGGTTPVAYFHTHPSPAGHAGKAPGTSVAKSFSDDDLDVAKDYGLIAYVAGRDGSMWRYDPPVEAFFYEGVRTLADKTYPAGDPAATTPPRPVMFNWTLKTR